MRSDAALSGFLDDRNRIGRLAGEGVAVVAQWRATPRVAALDRHLAALAADPPLAPQDFATGLASWLADRSWLDPLLDGALDAMRADDFASPGIDLISSPVVPGLALIHHPPVSLSLLLVDGVALAAANAGRLSFEPGLCLLCNAGRDAIATERWRADVAPDGAWRAHMTAVGQLAPGEWLVVDSWRDQLRIVPHRGGGTPGDAVLLRFAHAGGGQGARVREHDLADGTHVRSGFADVATSRIMMLLWLVRQADTTALAQVLPALLGHDEPVVRWEAARLWVSRDPAAAHHAVRHMARADADASVRQAAQATLGIIDAHLAQRAA